MKAWVLEQHGAVERAFELREMPAPKPGAGQVLVRSEGFGLNYADVMARRGLYREAPKPPCVIGYECVGRVEAIGQGVPEVLLGKRVTAITRFGGYAEQVVTDHRACDLVPEGLGLGEACALATQGCTAWYMSRYARPLRKGDRVLVHSAAGGVGHLLVSIAVRSGCEVFAIASGERKTELLKTMGAHHVIDRSRQDAHSVLRGLIGPNGLDVSFNAVGGSTFKKDLELLSAGGAVVIYGGAERGAGMGAFATLGFVWRMGLVIPIFLMMRSRSIIGVNMLHLGDRHPELLAAVMNEVVAASNEGWLVPHVGAVLPAGELAAAHELLESGRSTGKVVLRW
jgi:NADPH2:quinone reductase